MSKAQKLTRAERRARRAARPLSGIYGVRALDNGAGHRFGRYLCWADTPDEARLRVQAAGFHGKTSSPEIDPEHLPDEPPLPPELTARFGGWYRSRWNCEGWTDWEPLPADYRHDWQDPD